MKLEDIVIGNIYFVVKSGFGPEIDEVIALGELNDNNLVDLDGYIRIKSKINYGTYGCHIDCVFETRDDAVSYLQDKNRKIQEEYASNIKTPEDLVNFCLDFTVSYCEEYSDDNARQVVIDKMKEFGFTRKSIKD